MRIGTIQTLALMIVFLTITSVDIALPTSFFNTTIYWALFFVMYVQFSYSPVRLGTGFQLPKDIFLKIYLLWIIVCFVRGAFIAEDYWQAKFLIHNTFGLAIGLSVWTFAQPEALSKVIRIWFLVALPIFIPFSYILPKDLWGFYLSPVIILIVFIPGMRFRWAMVIVFLAILAIFADFGARSTFVRFSLPFLFLAGWIVKNRMPLMAYKIAAFSCFIVPPAVVIYSLNTGENPFQQIQAVAQQHIQSEDRMVTADTRTVIYKEVWSSAEKNGYIALGRTPARGYDSKYFGRQIARELNIRRQERPGSEVGLLNIFTWMGILGALLYSAVFFAGSFMAITQAQNWYVRILGVFLAFRWAYSWIEEFTTFSLTALTLWMIVAICYSPRFRAMNDVEFSQWISDCFPTVSWARSSGSNLL